MDIGKSFSFVFEDERWVNKLLIGGVLTLLSFLIVPAFIVLGYAAQTMRNVMAGESRPLPEWSDMGAYLRDGFMLFVVLIAYFVPYFVLSFLSGALADVNGMAFLAFLFSCVAFLYSIAINVVLPAAAGEYVTTNSIGSALRVADVWALVQQNLADFLVVFLLGIVASIIGGLGLIACFIGVGFTAFYSGLVRAHLWAQVYQKARGSGPVTVTTTAV